MKLKNQSWRHCRSKQFGVSAISMQTAKLLAVNDICTALHCRHFCFGKRFKIIKFNIEIKKSAPTSLPNTSSCFFEVFKAAKLFSKQINWTYSMNFVRFILFLTELRLLKKMKVSAPTFLPKMSTYIFGVFKAFCKNIIQSIFVVNFSNIVVESQLCYQERKLRFLEFSSEFIRLVWKLITVYL